MARWLARYIWDFRSSGLLRSVNRYFFTDVSGQTERGNDRLYGKVGTQLIPNLYKKPEERRPQFLTSTGNQTTIVQTDHRFVTKMPRQFAKSSVNICNNFFNINKLSILPHSVI